METNSPLNRARKIVDVKALCGDVGTPGGRAFDYPLWLGNDLVLAQSLCANGSFFQAYRLDLKTGRATLAAALTGAIHDHDFRGPWSLSADRRWVLWEDGWNTNRIHRTATRIDASRSVQWTFDGAREYMNPTFWLPGGHRWVRLVRENGGDVLGVHLYDLNRPRWSRRFRLTVAGMGSALGVQADGTICLTDSAEFSAAGGASRRFLPTRLRLTGGRLHVQTRRVPVPGGGVAQSLHLAPDGRLAWLQRQEDRASEVSVLVTDWDGRNLRHQGTLSFHEESDRWEVRLHGWFPDGKRLLMEVRGQLFSVPVV